MQKHWQMLHWQIHIIYCYSNRHRQPTLQRNAHLRLDMLCFQTDHYLWVVGRCNDVLGIVYITELLRQHSNVNTFILYPVWIEAGTVELNR